MLHPVPRNPHPSAVSLRLNSCLSPGFGKQAGNLEVENSTLLSSCSKAISLYSTGELQPGCVVQFLILIVMRVLLLESKFLCTSPRITCDGGPIFLYVKLAFGKIIHVKMSVFRSLCWASKLIQPISLTSLPMSSCKYIFFTYESSPAFNVKVFCIAPPFPS